MTTLYVTNCLDQYYPQVVMLGNIKVTYVSDSEWLRVGSYWDSANARMTDVTSGGPFGATSISFSSTSSQTQSLVEYRFPFGNEMYNPTSDFTIEGWYKFSAIRTVSDTVMTFKQSKSISGQGVKITIGTPGSAKFTLSAYSGSLTSATGSATITTGSWYHLAVVRSGTTMSLYVNGVLDATFTFSGALGIGNTTTEWAFNLGSDAGVSYQGQFDEMRLTYGVARYAATFPVPTARFPDSMGGPTLAISQVATALALPRQLSQTLTLPAFTQRARVIAPNVSLLLHMNGTNGSTTFVDSSPSPKTVTAVGAAAVTTSTVKFGTGALGCAGGTTDRLDVTADVTLDMEDADFTVEGFAYLADNNPTSYLLSGADSGHSSPRGAAVYVSSGQLHGLIYDAAGSAFGGVTGGVDVPATAWFHWAYVRSGTSFKLFVNGTQSGSTITASGIGGTPSYVTVGQVGTITGPQTVGDIDEVRVSKGIAQYTTTFTPTTVEFGSSGGTLSAAAAQTVAAFVQSATALEIPVALTASQTLPAISQAATVFGSSRSLVATQTVDVFTQTYLVSAPSRVVQTGVAGDPNYASVLLLLHGEGSITDTGPGARAMTSGGPAVTTAQAAVGTGSIEFQGSGASTTTPTVVNTTASSAFDMGSSDFTMEAWVRHNSTPGATFHLYLANAGIAQIIADLYFSDGATGFIPTLGAYYIDSGGTKHSLVTSVLGGGGMLTDTWQHIALSRNGSTLALYLNGRQVATTAISGALYAGATKATLQCISRTSYVINSAFRAWVDEVRVTKGVGRYPAGFQPALVAFPDVLGFADQLLIAQSATVTPPAPDRVLAVDGDPHYTDVVYLVHADSSSHPSPDPHYVRHIDDSKYASTNVWGTDSDVASVSGAFAGLASSLPRTTSAFIAAHDIYGYAPPISVMLQSTNEVRANFGEVKIGFFYALSTRLSLGLANGPSYPAESLAVISLAGVPSLVIELYGMVRSQSVPGTGDVLISQFGTVPIFPGVWYHIAVVRNNGTMSVFVNGVLDIQFALSTDLYQEDVEFTVGDTSHGFVFFSDRNPLQYVEEVRFTGNAARYSTEFVPPSTAFPNFCGGQFANFSQSGTLVHGIGSSTGSADQQVPAFLQTATAYGSGTRSAVASQTMPAFAQIAAATGQPIRLLGQTCLIDPFGQVATVAPPRSIDWAIQHVAPFTDGGGIASSMAAVSTKTFVITQNASALHMGDGASSTPALGVFDQVASVQALLALTKGQIVLPFGQSAASAVLTKLSAAQQLVAPPLIGLIEGAFVTKSERGIRIHPEVRTFTTPA